MLRKLPLARSFATAGPCLHSQPASLLHDCLRSGAKDKIIPILTETKAHWGTPGSWLTTVPDAGHAVPYQHPVQFAKQVLRFLDTGLPVGAGPGVPAVHGALCCMLDAPYARYARCACCALLQILA